VGVERLSIAASAVGRALVGRRSPTEPLPFAIRHINFDDPVDVAWHDRVVEMAEEEIGIVESLNR
jgi:hypothetical protein